VTRRISRALAAALFVFAGAFAGPVAAADPSPSPNPRPPTCAEQYPGEGPAGVDLQIGCLIRELIGHYSGEEPSGQAPRLTAYLAPILGVATSVLVAIGLLQLARRRAGRRLAPVTPSAWWLCSACRSVNATGKPDCYSCGAPWTPEAPIVPTAERPETIQRFGGDRKSASDRPGRGPDAPAP
jgi:hypothetical protein